MKYILLLAFIPVFIIGLFIYKRDVYQKEPIIKTGIKASKRIYFIKYTLMQK